MAEDADLEQLQDRLLDTLQQLLAGTEWSPPQGGIITDAVIVCGWREATGGAGRVYVEACPPWAAEGLLSWALRDAQDEGEDDED